MTHEFSEVTIYLYWYSRVSSKHSRRDAHEGHLSTTLKVYESQALCYSARAVTEWYLFHTLHGKCLSDRLNSRAEFKATYRGDSNNWRLHPQLFTKNLIQINLIFSECSLGSIFQLENGSTGNRGECLHNHGGTHSRIMCFWVATIS